MQTTSVQSEISMDHINDSCENLVLFSNPDHESMLPTTSAYTNLYPHNNASHSSTPVPVDEREESMTTSDKDVGSPTATGHMKTKASQTIEYFKVNIVPNLKHKHGYAT